VDRLQTDLPVTAAPPKSWPRRAVDGLRLVAGFIGLFMAAIWIGMTNYNLPSVLAVDQRIFEPTQPAEWKVIMTVVMAMSMVAVTGVWTFDGRELGQVFAAVWAGFWFLAAANLLYSAQFTSNPGCTYENCWPSPFQEVMIAVPVGAALIVMTCLAAADRPRSAWVRGAVPALVLLVLAAVQELVWPPGGAACAPGPTAGMIISGRRWEVAG
jgi:hypothetical protein